MIKVSCVYLFHTLLISIVPIEERLVHLQNAVANEKFDDQILAFLHFDVFQFYLSIQRSLSIGEAIEGMVNGERLRQAT